jgi:hypothetical protein
MMTGGAENFGDAAQLIDSAAQDSAATEMQPCGQFWQLAHLWKLKSFMA